ncbi:GPI inositol-deacylase [Pleurostoma richardsiae]|uniref:GPI inositol-deacylase n=1 Tax=Pleurostoma richardsiae TaxID=41990 RepID=A0AA38R7G0_9PEZI|nr:GPI inositol-deacylase [Pleurostoma richardsiae]
MEPGQSSRSPLVRVNRAETSNTANTANTSSSARSFLGSIVRRGGRTPDQGDGPKGPFGLSLLYEPEDQTPVADLIFVHGLNGGSYSTWTKGDESTFWPQKWLPEDAAFADVRIHTFGYHSGLSRDSILNIHDFARSLLGAIHDAPGIPRNQGVPLILIGHSMGGLVVKRAYIIASQTAEYHSIFERVYAMVFLATPHQGSHLSQTLNRLLSLHGPRPFVHDLFPASLALQSINEEFPSVSSSLRLFSFFETLPIGGIGLIVEKPAAVLNYPNERRMYLAANHRDVARFSSRDDPSYVTVRNALATTIDEQRSTATSVVPAIPSGYSDTPNAPSRLLDSLVEFLGVKDAPEDVLMTLDSLRLEGSCEWLLQRATFIEWRDALSSKLYWLRGRPGAGKSVLASAIISHLRELDKDCCFFFFVKADKSKVTINSFLRSMAFQMASLHPEVLTAVLDVAETWNETSIDKNDANLVWRKLFLAGLLKVRLNRPQYWIIDAMDEARGGQELTTFLAKAQELWPLCILVTSRNSIDSYKSTVSLKMEVTSEVMTEDDNQTDISLFLECNLERFPAPSLDAQRAMAEHILQSARGCFLWAQVVVKELLQVRTAAQANRVLHSNPSDMNDLYLRILHDMSETRFNKDLVKAILTWAACAVRPLYMDELQHAIETDIKDEIDDMERSVGECCGNLVYVDKLRKLQLIHLTAREFLTRQDVDSEYKIERGAGHRQLAMVCLECLSDHAMKPVRGKRSRKSSSFGAQVPEKSPLADYAAEFLFHHLSQARSYDDELLIRVSEFLMSGNVLGWIEYVARHFDLQKIFQAGKTISHILERRAEHTPPIGLHEERACMSRWANDLIHLVTKFGKRLSATPFAIHHLIPPFCPPGSAIREQFSSPKGLSVHGLQATGWDDCLSTMSYPKPERPQAIAASAENIALGTSKGRVILYDHTTFQESQSTEHRELVWSLAFSSNGKMVAIGGPRRVRVWDVETGEERFEFPTKALCMALAFDNDDNVLWAALRNNTLLCWDICSGELFREPVNWTKPFQQEGSELYARAPDMAVFCIHMGLLAIVYRGEDLILWELDDQRLYDVYEKDIGSTEHGSTKQADGVSSVWDVAFSAAPETSLLAAAYFDGDLILYDTETGVVVNTHTSANSQTLCSSPDGRTLAAGDSRGNIELYDFPTLKFLYRIQFEADALKIRTLAFTADNLRLVEIRGSQCRIWEPSVLLRQDADDETSDMISISTAPLEIQYEAVEAHNITAMVCLRSAPFVFCGKEDGAVYVYDVQDSQNHQLFLQTRNCPVMLLHFDTESNILTCCDVASRVTARRVSRKSQHEWEVSDILLDTRPARRISQILASGRHSRLLLSTDKHDTLWPLDGTADGDKYVKRIDGRESPRWVPHINSQHLILVEETGAKIYAWQTLEHLASVTFAALDPPMVSSTIPLHHQRFFATVSRDPPDSTPNRRSAIHVWNMDDFNVGSNFSSIKPAFDLGTLVTKIEHTIGVVGDRLVFLDRDYWVCSVDLTPTRDLFRRRGVTTGSMPVRRQSAGASSPSSSAAPSSSTGIPIGMGNIVRHFFVPYDWISLVNELHVDVGRGGEILFVKRSELAVIKRGLDFSDTGTFYPRRASGPAAGLPVRPGLQTVHDRERHSV